MIQIHRPDRTEIRFRVLLFKVDNNNKGLYMYDVMMNTPIYIPTLRQLNYRRLKDYRVLLSCRNRANSKLDKPK